MAVCCSGVKALSLFDETDDGEGVEEFLFTERDDTFMPEADEKRRWCFTLWEGG
jgi:hypothetical protein